VTPVVRDPGRRGMTALLLAIICLNSAGCWGATDIDERAFVLMLGLDVTDEGMRISAQIAINERMTAEAGGEGEAFTVIHHDALSTSEGINLLQDTASMPLYLGHLKVVVLGEEFVKQRGLVEAVGALEREPEVRGQVWVVQAVGKAEDLLSAKSKAVRIPASQLERLLNTGLRFGHAPDSRLINVNVRLNTHGYHVILPILKEEGGAVEISGASILRGDRAVTEIGHELVHDYSLVSGASSVGVYSVASPRGAGRLYAIVRNPRQKIGVTRKSDGVAIYLRITAEAEAVEDTGPTRSGGAGWGDIAARVPEVERMLGDEIAGRVANLIEKVQTDSGADVFGFVRYAGNLKFVEGAWDEVFPGAEVRVEVQVRLRRFGMGEA